MFWKIKKIVLTCLTIEQVAAFIGESFERDQDPLSNSGSLLGKPWSK